MCGVITASADVLEDLTNGNKWTLFAPPDSAFAAISGNIRHISEDDFYRVILFHGADGVVDADDLKCGDLVDMLDAGSSRFICRKNSDGEDIVIQKGGGKRKNDILPEIVQANIVACNGMIHVVDQVMLPNFIDKFDKFN